MIELIESLESKRALPFKKDPTVFYEHKMREILDYKRFYEVFRFFILETGTL